MRLIVEDGLEAYLPLADLVDAAKEKERLGKQATKLQGEIEVRVFGGLGRGKWRGFGISALCPHPSIRSLNVSHDNTKYENTKHEHTQGLEKRLSGTAFLSKAPPELVASTQQSLAEKKEQLATIQRSMEELGA